MKEEKKWGYDFYSWKNSVFEKQEAVGKEKWEREEMEPIRLRKENATIENWKTQHLGQ